MNSNMPFSSWICLLAVNYPCIGFHKYLLKQNLCLSAPSLCEIFSSSSFLHEMSTLPSSSLTLLVFSGSVVTSVNSWSAQFLLFSRKSSVKIFIHSLSSSSGMKLLVFWLYVWHEWIKCFSSHSPEKHKLAKVNIVAGAVLA